MSTTIGPIFGGRTARGSPRPRRRAPLGLETLEPRLLLAGGVSSMTPDQLPQAPAQVVTSGLVAPVTIHLPEGDSTLAAIAWPPGDQEEMGTLRPGGAIDLYRVTVGPGSGSQSLVLSFDTLPRGDTGRLLAFDRAGDLLIDRPIDAAAARATVDLAGFGMTRDAELDVGIRLLGSVPGSSPAGEVPYHLQITPAHTVDAHRTGIAAGAPHSAGPPVVLSTAQHPVLAGDGLVIGGAGPGPVAHSPGASTSTGPTVSGGTLAGAQSPSAAWVSPTAGGTSVSGQGSSPSTLVRSDAVVFPTVGRAQLAGGADQPTDAPPLPGSNHQPAGGILADAGPAEDLVRNEGMRVDLSLVRLLSPGREARRHDVPSSDRGAGSLSEPRLDPGLSSPQDITLQVERASDAPRRFRHPGRLSAAASGPNRGEAGLASRRPVVPAPWADGGPLEGLAQVAAAALPPLDGSDRPGTAAEMPLPGEAAGDREPAERVIGSGQAILLGLSGSAALGLSLYAPDLAAAVRRAVPRASPNARPRPTSSRGDRLPE
jgi:hypothetical protein